LKRQGSFDVDEIIHAVRNMHRDLAEGLIYQLNAEHSGQLHPIVVEAIARAEAPK